MIAKAGLMVCLKLKPECDLCGSRFKDAMALKKNTVRHFEER